MFDDVQVKNVLAACGDQGGTSIAVTLAVANAPVQAFTYSWAQVEATLPPAAVFAATVG